MADVEAFLASTMQRLTETDTAFHNGDVGPRMAMWSRRDPVTLFGAAKSGSGWSEIGPTFEWLAFFRRDDGEWKVAHRHADPVSGSASAHDLLGHFDDEQDAR